MSTPTTHDEHGTPTDAFKRLPKWARQEIMSLKRKARDAEAYAAELRHEMDDPETKVFIGNFVEGDIPLPAHTRIIFKMDGFEIEASASERDNSVAVRVNGGGSIGIWPEVSNSVRIEAKRR